MESFKSLMSIVTLAFASSLVGCAADEEPTTKNPDVATEGSEQELFARRCKSDGECPAPKVACIQCGDGSVSCPDASCVHHQCVASFPQCPPLDPCATVRCAAGTHCEVGACVADQSKQFCGGIAGIACPGAGKCVDDPSDSCNPLLGGADCGGMCQCTELALCAIGHHWDSSLGVCACVPDSIPGPSCGRNTCGAGQYCCNASCGICAPKGAVCIQIACD